MQRLEERLESIFRCKRGPKHACFKHILQSLECRIIIVSRFSYFDNQFIENGCLIFLNLNIMLGSYEYILQATIDYHGLCLYCCHYTLSVYCREKISYYSYDKTAVCDINHTRCSSTLYIILNEWLGGEYISRALRMGNNALPWGHNLYLDVSLPRL